MNSKAFDGAGEITGSARVFRVPQHEKTHVVTLRSQAFSEKVNLTLRAAGGSQIEINAKEYSEALH